MTAQAEFRRQWCEAQYTNHIKERKHVLQTTTKEYSDARYLTVDRCIVEAPPSASDSEPHHKPPWLWASLSMQRLPEAADLLPATMVVENDGLAWKREHQSQANGESTG